jgi:hypothetical protein
MNKFKLICSWIEYHSGELIIEAKDKEQAVNFLESDQNRLLELLIDKYANETFNSLNDITVIPDSVSADEELDLVIDGGKLKIC